MSINACVDKPLDQIAIQQAVASFRMPLDPQIKRSRWIINGFDDSVGRSCDDSQASRVNHPLMVRRDNSLGSDGISSHRDTVQQHRCFNPDDNRMRMIVLMFRMNR